MIFKEYNKCLSVQFIFLFLIFFVTKVVGASTKAKNNKKISF